MMRYSMVQQQVSKNTAQGRIFQQLDTIISCTLSGILQKQHKAKQNPPQAEQYLES